MPYFPATPRPRGQNNQRSNIMKSTGITRPVDILGRVVIPMEIRENLGINAKDLLEIYGDGYKIVLTKHNDSCLFCSTEDDLVNFDGHKICKSCLAKRAKFNEA